MLANFILITEKLGLAEFNVFCGIQFNANLLKIWNLIEATKISRHRALHFSSRWGLERTV